MKNKIKEKFLERLSLVARKDPEKQVNIGIIEHVYKVRKYNENDK
ncbi:hypothetical protein [Clostridium botulinum]|nr:hypothetical protein [Clostridium botulinum]BDB02999.1 hypothetical protein CBOS2020_30730 [Clostridium botulinum]